MTKEEFKAWRDHMGWSRREAAEALGISQGSVELYELGHRRDNGNPMPVPKAIELACAALAQGIRSYSGPGGLPKE